MGCQSDRAHPMRQLRQGRSRIDVPSELILRVPRYRPRYAPWRSSTLPINTSGLFAPMPNRARICATDSPGVTAAPQCQRGARELAHVARQRPRVGVAEAGRDVGQRQVGDLCVLVGA